MTEVIQNLDKHISSSRPDYYVETDSKDFDEYFEIL
jgi:hypothetical protein